MIPLCTILCLQLSRTMAFSNGLAGQRASVQCDRSSRNCELQMTTSDDESRSHQNGHRTGRKRAILRKYSKAIALSTTLIYGPMASAPLARRFIGGSTAHAASSAVAPSQSDYNFEDFKDVKKKLSLAPGANVQKYEEILDRVAVEGDAALGDLKPGELETLTIGGSGEGEGAATIGKKGRSKRKTPKKQIKKQQVSEWESDEFGFADEEEDELEGVLNMGRTVKPVKGKRKSAVAGVDREKSSDVVITDKMAFNNYQEALSKTDHIKTLRKLSFYTISPVFVITMIRGQIRAYREKKKVKRGLALFEQEKKEYEEELKNKKKNKNKGDGEDGDDDDDDYDEEEDDEYDD